MNIRSLHFLSLVTLIGLGGIGWLVITFIQKNDLIEILQEGYIWYAQIGIGIAYGAAVAWGLAALIGLKFFSPVNKFFNDLLFGTKLTYHELLWFSICAGVGEEILFRAGIQPYIGIWLTAFIFIAMHGYIYQIKGPVIVFAIAMITMSAGLGYLFAYVGLLSAIIAHIVIDIIGFSRIKVENDRWRKQFRKIDIPVQYGTYSSAINERTSGEDQ